MQLLELAHTAMIKDLLEDPHTRDQFRKRLSELYDVVFSDDEKELFRTANLCSLRRPSHPPLLAPPANLPPCCLCGTTCTSCAYGSIALLRVWA